MDFFKKKVGVTPQETEQQTKEQKQDRVVSCLSKPFTDSADLTRKKD